jgi:rhodanese-related sulfurtransferase
MKDQMEYYEKKLRFELDSWDLNDSLRRGIEVRILDMRSIEAYEKEHIPGAISLPHRTINIENTAHFSRDILYITYCNGIGCNASTKGALKLLNLGFQVKELSGGLDWWKRDGHETHGSKVMEEKFVVCNC